MTTKLIWKRAAVAAVASFALVGGTAPLAVADNGGRGGCKGSACQDAKGGTKGKGNKGAKAEAKAEAKAVALAASATAGYQALTVDPTFETLPASLKEPLRAAAQEALLKVETLTADVTDARMSRLARIVAELRALQPAPLQAAVGALGAEVSSSPDAAAVSALIDALLSAELADVQLPEDSDLAELADAAGQVEKRLGRFAPVKNDGAVKNVSAAVRNVTAALVDGEASVQQVLADLAAVSGGVVPSDAAAFTAALLQVLTGTGETAPVDPGTGETAPVDPGVA